MNSVAGVAVPRKEKPKRDDKAVKVDRRLARKAKIIADNKGISVAELLTELIRPGIEREWVKARKALDEEEAE